MSDGPEVALNWLFPYPGKGPTMRGGARGGRVAFGPAVALNPSESNRHSPVHSTSEVGLTLSMAERLLLVSPRNWSYRNTEASERE